MTNALLLRRRGMMAARQGGLPYDAAIEYLQKNGSAYIDTGILGNEPKSVDLRVMSPTYSTYQCVIGCLHSSNPSTHRFAPVIVSSTKLVGVTYYSTSSSGGKDISQAMADSIPFVVMASLKPGNQKSMVKLDTESTFSTKVWTESRTVNAGYNMFLFAANNNGTAQSYMVNGARIYYCKIYDDDSWTNLVRDFIPVRVGTVGYMYDRVSGQLFGNAGTGAFVLGPDVQ